MLISLTIIAISKLYYKAYLQEKNSLENFLEIGRRMSQKQKQEKTERATGVGRITRKHVVKVESNDSPQIPDRGKTSGPLRVEVVKEMK